MSAFVGPQTTPPTLSGTANATAASAGYVQRTIDVLFQIGQGNYGEAGLQSWTVSGARVISSIERTGIPGFSTAHIQIFGLSLDEMNLLTTMGSPEGLFQRRNIVVLKVGGAGIYTGIIQDAWADFAGMPDVAMTIESHTGLIDLTKPVPPTSYKGPVDVATIMAGLAAMMGYKFENNGISVVLQNPYLPGTAREQALACADAARIAVYIDDQAATLAIWPLMGHRAAIGAIPLLSAATGLLGYPGYAGISGISLRSLFNPSLRFGAEVQVVSQIKAATGVWVINKLTHLLDANMPGGRWFTELEAYKYGQPAPLPR